MGCLVVSAVLFYFSFPNYFFPLGFSSLAWVFAIPLFFVLENQTFFRRIYFGVILGLLSYFPLVSWVAPIHIAGYLLFVFTLSLQPILFCAFFKGGYRGIFFDLFYISALWVFTEFVRAKLMGGFSWTIGNSQAFFPEIIQISNLTGAYGVSFIIIWVNYCAYQILFKKKNKIYYGAIIFLMFLVTYGYSRISIARGRQGEVLRTTACTIQPNISAQDKANPELIDKVFDQQITLSHQCFSNMKPDIIIWPETAAVDDVTRDEIMNKKTINFVTQTKTPLLVGSAMLIKGKNFNSAVLFDKTGEVKNIYHKQQLVPFMEKQFKVGKDAGIFQLSEKRNFGVTICSEDGYPKIFRKLMKNNPKFITVILNDAWFNQEAGLMMHLQNSVMRAVEFGVSIIRSANTGWSGYIDLRGKIENLDKDLNRRKIFKVESLSFKRKTFYGRFGDVFAVLCGIFVIITRIEPNPTSGVGINPTPEVGLGSDSRSV